jgi:hypothetical protein
MTVERWVRHIRREDGFILGEVRAVEPQHTPASTVKILRHMLFILLRIKGGIIATDYKRIDICSSLAWSTYGV